MNAHCLLNAVISLSFLIFELPGMHKLQSQRLFIKKLIDDKGDLNKPYPQLNNDPPLVWVSECDDYHDLLQELLKHAIDIRITAEANKTSLHSAAASAPDNLKTLLAYIQSKYSEQRAKQIINAPDIGGFTPLHEASSHACVKSVKLLIESGACLESRDYQFHFTPFGNAVDRYKVQYAARKTMLDIMRLLYVNGSALGFNFQNGLRDPLGIAYKSKSAIYTSLADRLQKVHEREKKLNLVLRGLRKGSESFFCLFPHEVIELAVRYGAIVELDD